MEKPDTKVGGGKNCDIREDWKYIGHEVGVEAVREVRLNILWFKELTHIYITYNQ